jgi:hypothetical protein
MPIQSSFPKIADQIINYNNNVVDILSKIDTLVTSSESSVTVNITDSSGVIRQLNVPTVGYLKSEIDRLNNNINSIYSINEAGALIQTTNGTKFKKVVTVDLNKEPNDIRTLDLVTQFKTGKNWFFDSMLNPQLFIEIDLSNKVENNVRKVLSRRYIVEFERLANGNLTENGQKALDSFNILFRNKNDFSLETFISWHDSTQGVLNQFAPNTDEQMFDLDPNFLELDGTFTVIKTETDTLNKKLFYHLNTLNYARNQMVENGEMIQQQNELGVGDELIINTPNSYTRYKILEVYKSSQNPKVTLERVEGNQPIPIGVVGSLKIYSPVIYKKTVKISFGYDERNVVFIKPLNMENYILSKKWSDGLGFYTNDLFNFDSGQSLNTYYNSVVDDYGEVLKDLVKTRIPVTSAATPNAPLAVPNAPVLDVNTFKVQQINTHQTDSTDSSLLRDLNNQLRNLQSEAKAIFAAIKNKQKQIQLLGFQSDSTKAQFENDLEGLKKNYERNQSLSSSITQQILSLTNSLTTKVDPVYSVRGFFPFPSPVYRTGGKVQEVVRFKIQYRYLSKSGQEAPVETFDVPQNDQTTTTAAFSNWTETLSNVRARSFDSVLSTYTWEPEDLSNADVPNINQVDIPIKTNERVEIRIKSISEVGYPESPLESNWSNSVFIDFPEELNTVSDQNALIQREAQSQELKSSVMSELSSMGYDTHISDQVVVNNVTYRHSTNTILSGFVDDMSNPIDLFAYLRSLQDRIKSLEDQVTKIKGELEVVIIRNSESFVIRNGSEISFNIECEDYLEKYESPGVPSGRVYANNIYVVKDFLLRIRNKSTQNALGLLSSRSYDPNTNASVLSSAAPQVFWVDQQDQLLVSNVTGTTKTQLDNQFIWSVNYDSLNQTTVDKLSGNVGNDFITNSTNSLTGQLSSNEYNLGFSGFSILNFVGNNLSLFDKSKWIDRSETTSSSTKFLTTIHPRIPSLQRIQETNSDKVFSLEGGASNDINIPINIYFKMNALDSSRTGLNYTYVNLNAIKTSVKHIKKLKFLLENENDNKPFIFSIKFTINRAKLVSNKTIESTPLSTIANR